MKVRLVFEDWQRKGRSIYATEEGLRLSMGDFHSGSTFDATIEVDEEQAAELHRALSTGACPVFWVSAS
mgnify:CR=1 FL=1